MIQLFFFILVLIFSACGSNPNDEAYLKYTRNMAILIDSSYGLKVYGLGGFNDKGIKGYSFTFMTYKKMDIDQARILMVNVIEDILRTTNKDLRNLGKPELSLYYYEITIIFSDEKTKLSYSADESISTAIMIKKDISYYERNIDKPGFKEIYHEPYSEAYEKVFGKQFVEDSLPLQVK